MLACAQENIPGEAIDYDFTNDVGLIRIRPGRKLPASRVVPTFWQPKKGMPHDHRRLLARQRCHRLEHDNPRASRRHEQHIHQTGIRHDQVHAHQPKEGRSGGGLYTSDGYVAGVCDFADPSERVGLYAVPEAIHKPS